MNSFIFSFLFSIVMISAFVYVVKNHEMLSKMYEKNKDKKLVKIIVSIIVGFAFLILVIMIGQNINTIIRYTFSLDDHKENLNIFENTDELLAEEQKNYNELINKDYESKSNSPYIPDGFTYKEGDVETGFVIVDNTGSEYVWVPCFNKEVGNVPKLEKRNFTEEPFIYADACVNESTESFLKSALENGGFYISRYELGKENDKLVSKKGIEIEKDIFLDDAKVLLKNETESYNIEIINGYAYDTALAWIMKTNDIKLEFYDVNKPIISGRNEYNKINDIADNIMEYTTENEYGSPIIRGFPFDGDNSKYDNVVKNYDRLSIKNDKKTFSAGTKIGIRAIIYK